jgi:hypothetical protein
MAKWILGTFAAAVVVASVASVLTLHYSLDEWVMMKWTKSECLNTSNPIACFEGREWEAHPTFRYAPNLNHPAPEDGRV